MSVAIAEEDLAMRLDGLCKKMLLLLMHIDTSWIAACHREAGWGFCHTAAFCVVSWAFNLKLPGSSACFLYWSVI